MGGKRPNTPEDFWKKVAEPNENGCRLWQGRLSVKGYGLFSFAGKDERAHRLAWIFSGGKKIPEGMMICHQCDVRNCVEPTHLFLGTNADNVIDCVQKGRHRNGWNSNKDAEFLRPSCAQPISA